MRRQIGRGLGGLGIVGAVAALAVGCGSSGSGSSGSGSSGSGSSGSGSSGSSGSAQVPTVNLTRAADVSSAARGYKIAETVHETIPSVGQINVDGTGSFTPASHLGAMTMQMHLPASAGTTSLQMQMVLDRTALYLKLPAVLASKIPGGKPWLYVNLDQAAKAAGIPGLGSLFSSASSMSNPTQQLEYLRATAAGSVKSLGKATVNGVQTTGYHAVVDLTKLPSVVPAAQRQAIERLVAALKQKGLGTLIPTSVWIDSSDLIRRTQMTLTEPLPNSTGTARIAMTQDFLEYGRQPAPTVPSATQSVNLFSLIHNSGTGTGA